MDNIEIVLRILLVVDAIALIVLVLLQQGKGASMGAAFGSGSSQTVFGSAGASSFLTKLTAWLAVAFFVITLALAWAARESAEARGQVGVPQVENGDASDGETQAPTNDSDVPFTFDAQGSDDDDVPAVEQQDENAGDEVPETP